MRDLSVKIDGALKKSRIRAARAIKKAIHAKALAMKKTGNLAAGVYEHHTKNASFVGIHAPGFQNYLIEEGHYAGKREVGGRLRAVVIGTSAGGNDIARVRRVDKYNTPDTRKFVRAHPIVYPTFVEEAERAIQIMSEPMVIT
jgi:hypothetical protein